MEEDGSLVGATVVDGGGDIVGRIVGLLVDPGSLTGRWLRLQVRPDSANAIVPLMVASADGSGRLVIPYDRATVSAAPSPVADVVSEPEADALMRHYGLSQ